MTVHSGASRPFR